MGVFTNSWIIQIALESYSEEQAQEVWERTSLPTLVLRFPGEWLGRTHANPHRPAEASIDGPPHWWGP